MSDFKLEPLMLTIAEEFKRRDMRTQLEHLRQYFRVYRARKRALLKHPQPPWDEEMVLFWACVFRIPPLDGVYPVLGRAVPCPSCRADMNDGRRATIRCAWPGGVVRACRACNARWLEFDA